MKTNKATLTSVVLAAVILGMTATVAAQPALSDDQDNATVYVTVASKIAVDISPSNMSYSGINPGEFVNESDDVTAGPGNQGWTGVEIENIGSENISQVWLNTSVPTNNPFGGGGAAAYDAGNFIVVNSSGDTPDGLEGLAGPDSNYTYVNRREYNESNRLSYIFTPDAGEWRYGRFRSGDQEFFWAINVTSGGACQTGDAGDFRVGNRAHNQSSTGSVDFTAGGDFTAYTPTSPAGASEQVLVPNVQISRPDGVSRSYDVLVNCDDSGATGTFTMRTKYNPTMGEATDLTVDGTVAQHLINSTAPASSEQELQPGEHFSIDVGIEVPLGVASGGVSPGTLRVFVNSLEG